MHIEQTWPFDQPPDVAAVTTRQVLEGGLPILIVTHYSKDHDWGFVCGTTSDVKDGRVIGMGSVLKLDLTLWEIADLPPGWTARRKRIGGPWKRFQDKNV